jgi:hypothetical protein
MSEQENLENQNEEENEEQNEEEQTGLEIPKGIVYA